MASAPVSEAPDESAGAPVLPAADPGPGPGAATLHLSDRRVGALLVLALLLTYSVILVTPYAVTDDYFVLAKAMRGEPLSNSDRAYKAAVRGEPSLMASIARGCFTSAYLTHWAFSAADEVADLRWIRLLGVLGIGLTALMLFFMLKRAGWPIGRSACLAFVMCTTPSFQVCASWTISFTVFYSCAATGLACLLVSRAADRGGVRKNWRAYAGALALLYFAVTIYQVTLLYFVVFAAIDLFRPTEQHKNFLRRFITHAAVMAAALALGFITYKIGVAIFGRWLSQARTEMVTDYAKKLDYFFRAPLRDAFQLHKLTPVANLPLVIATFTFGGLYLFFQGSWRWRLAMLGLTIAAIPAVYLPNLLSAENWGAYRTQIGLTGLTTFYVFAALHGYARFAARWWAKAERVPAVVLPMAAAFTGLLAAHNVARYYAEPQMLEIRVMHSQLARVDLQKVKKIHIAGSPWIHAINGSFYDEFGLPTTSQLFAEVPMTYVLVRERMKKHPPFPILVAPNNQIFRPPVGEYLINMTRLDLFR